MNAPAFNPSTEQQQVIAHRGTHLQVIACAGAGKTEAISRRISPLVQEGVEPSHIVAFTFTERAAEALKSRITARIEETMGKDFLDRIGAMYIGTIHAYCLKLLQDHVPEYGNYDILDENRLAGLLSREYKRLELGKLGNQHWKPIADFVRNANVVENELIDRKTLLGTPFGDCYNEFCKTLDKYHFITYGRLIAAAVHFLQTPTVFNRVHGQLRHLIVDEYQDVNPAQEKLIAILARDPVQLCVVADDDQSIYQWRGSDVSHMLEFASRYHATPVMLSVNRRSRPKIIAEANRFATSISPRLDKRMEQHREAGGPEVHAWSAETAAAEARVIADTIIELRQRGYRYKDVAVLYRSVRSGSPPLTEELKARGIPFRCAGRTGLFLQPEARVLGMLYAWLSNNDWKSERYGKSQPVTLDDLDHEFAECFNDGKPVAQLRGYLTDWRSLAGDTSAPINLVRDYYRLLNLLGVRSLDLDDPATSVQLGTLARFSMILADFEHVTRRGRFVDEQGHSVYRGGTDRGSYFYQRLFNYLQFYALDAYEDFEGEDSFDLDCVDILTIHQSKGLEWPVVFLPGLVNGRFPSKFAGQAQGWLIPESAFPPEIRRRYEGSEAEERRLFYVAMTRARDALYLSRFQKLQNSFKPSPFLVEVAGGDPPVVTSLPLPEPYIPPVDEPQQRPTVSFSELSLYEQCPLRFRLSTSLGFQPQLVSELGYGKAIHHILRKIADLTKEKGSLPNRTEVEDAFRDAFYLPFANNASFHNLFDRARALVEKYLCDYSGDLLRV
jgi:DNA helicase-2/ATP-dependent DNA helicase PcrA